MKKLLIVLGSIVLLTSMLGGQTILIDPTGDGGFEDRSSFTFTETFETNSPTLSSWTQVRVQGSSNWTYTSSGGHNNSRFAQFTQSGSSNNPNITKLISPAFDLSGFDTANLSFYYKQGRWGNRQNTLKVYYRTSPSSSWIQIAHYQSNVSNWTQAQLSLTNLSSQYQLAFEGIDVQGYANGLDSVTLSASVVTPDNPNQFSASTIDMSSINLNWQKNANNNDVLIAVNNTGSFSNPLDNQSYTVGSTLGCGSEIIYIGSATSFLHSGLSPESTYHYKAWSVNQVNMYSTGISTQGSTASLPISTFPFTENFEADSPHLSKWTQITETGSNLWTIATGSSGGSITAAHSGTYNARFTSSSGGPHITKLLSPVFDLSAISEAELAFWYAQEVWSGDQNELKVYYRSSSLSAWVQIAHYAENVAVWTQTRLTLPNLSSTYQIAFEGIDRWGYANVIDDVTIQPVYAEPVISVSPNALDFGLCEIGDTIEKSFTISNIGSGDLVLSRQPGLIGSDSSQFQLIDNNSYPLTITFADPALYTVKYLPSVSGNHSAQISISYDVEHVVNLSGRAGYLLFEDDFEAHADFTLDLSPWTQHDGDLSTTYSITDVTFLNQGYTGSYIAFNPTATTPVLGASWDAHSGAKYAAAFAATAPPNNDWLISPQINFGDDPLISFWAKSVTAQYGLERFKVLYSTTGNSYSDFNNYLAGSATEYVEAPTTWTQYIFDLPASIANTSIYIAIQCVSNDAFVFMVDDFQAWGASPPVPKISVSPNLHNFPNFFPNYSRYQAFTITNSGNAVLQINEGGMSISGDDEFSFEFLPDFPIMLSGGQSSTFWLRFHPTEPGNYSATISITDVLGNAANIPITATTLDDLVTEFPYVEGFEADVFGWVIRDADGDGLNWELLTNNAETHFAYTGHTCLVSRSWIADPTRSQTGVDSFEQAKSFQDTQKDQFYPLNMRGSKSDPKGALTPDNWLITPRLQLEESYTLSWRVAAQDPAWPAEKYSVLISTTTPDQDQFTLLHTETMTDGEWHYRELDLSAYEGQIVYLAFRHHDTTDQFIIKLDAIKVSPYNTDIFYGIVEAGGEVDITMDPIQDLTQNIPLNVVYHGSGLTEAALITSHICYNHPGLGLSNAGLHLGLSGSSFGGSLMQITHSLGFAPIHAYWRIQPGAWHVITPDSPEVSIWNDTTVAFTVNDLGKSDGDFDIVFPKTRDDTLPVELSHFGAIVSAQNHVNITWVTQTETNVSGFQLYRSHTEWMSDALVIGAFIPATNTSQMQSYLYVDKEVYSTGTYYYWLEHQDLDGSSETHGPVQVYFDAEGVNNPSVPVISGISGIYPNPFNPSTTIKVGISDASHARLSIYNARGQLVRVLLDQSMSKGYHKLLWDGRDDSGRACGSGIYFAVLNAGRDSFSRKLVMVK